MTVRTVPKGGATFHRAVSRPCGLERIAFGGYKLRLTRSRRRLADRSERRSERAGPRDAFSPSASSATTLTTGRTRRCQACKPGEVVDIGFWQPELRRLASDRDSGLASRLRPLDHSTVPGHQVARSDPVLASRLLRGRTAPNLGYAEAVIAKRPEQP